MFKSAEAGGQSSERDPRVTEGQEIRWIYTTSLPHEEGKADVQLVLGVTDSSTWLQPIGSATTRAREFAFDLPVNFVVDDETLRCTAKGSVVWDGNRLQLTALNMPGEGLQLFNEAQGNIWSSNVVQRLSPDVVFDTIGGQIVDQCNAFLRNHPDITAAPSPFGDHDHA